LDDSTDEPRNPHVSYEPGDIDASFLAKFGIGMVFLVIVFCFGLWGLFDYMAHRAAEIEGPPLRANVKLPSPPQPALQKAPAADYQTFLAEEQRQMEQYGWVDPDKGIVRIPVARAMELTLQKGLPVLPPQESKAQ
jgi:hypothetical protein